MTKDLMEFMGLEIEELCPDCGNVLTPAENEHPSGLCETCRDTLYYDSYDEGDNDYL